MSIVFAYDVMDSNFGSTIIEIIIAGNAAYFFAKYFFTKEMRMKEREENVKNQKVKNDFKNDLREVHTISKKLATSKIDISSMELNELLTCIYKAIESHKIFKPTNIENRIILENMDVTVKKWTDGKMKSNDPTLKLDMNIIFEFASKIGMEYNFNLSTT